MGISLALTQPRGTGAASWSPTVDAATYPILRWYRADNPANTYSGSALTQLTDKSTNAVNLTQGSAGNRPTLVAAASPSGRDILRFDGSDDYMLGATPFLTNSVTGYTIFVALKSVGTANGHVLTEGNDGNDLPFFKALGPNGTSNNTNAAGRNNANSVYFNADHGVSNPWSASVANVIAVTDDLTTSTAYVNDVVGTTPVASTRVGTSTVTNFTIGAWKRTGVIQPLAMDLYELFVVQGVADSTYRGNAYAYLKAQWGTA